MVDQNLVRWTDSDDTSRFTILETIREYASGQLTVSAEKTRAHDAHAAYFLALAEEAMPTSQAPRILPGSIGWRPSTTICWQPWAGLPTAVTSPGPSASPGHSAGSGITTATFRKAGSGWNAPWLWMQMTRPAARRRPPARTYWSALECYCTPLGEGERAVALLEAGAALRRADGDDLGGAYAESLRGGALVSLGRYDEAEKVFEEILRWWRSYEGHVMAGHALFHLGLVAYTRDDRERTRALCQEAVELFDAGQSWLDAIEPLHYLGLNACAADDLPAAAAFFAEALARLRVRRSRVDFANGFADVATLAVARGDLVPAARLFGAADAIRREDGAPFPLPARDRL